MILCKAGFLFLFIFCIDYTFGKLYNNGIILDARVEYQREPWLTVNVRKFVNAKGSYNFKFHWQVVRNIADATVVLQEWPLIPYILPDGFYLNLTLVDKACDAIREDFFRIFSSSQSNRPCVSGKNLIKKGDYYFEHNIDNTALVRGRDIGTMVYVLDINHAGVPLLRVRFLVDTSVLIKRKKHDYKLKNV